MKIKNWKHFQHFKDRRPLWIKLYKELLDDMDWHKLSGESAKFLINLWLLASEDENKDGMLPCIETIAFRFRINERTVIKLIPTVSKWLIIDDIDMISSEYQDDALEKRQRREENTYVDRSVNQCPYFEIQEEWNRLCRKSGLSVILVLNDKRKKTILKNWKQSFFRENWKTIFFKFHSDKWRRDNKTHATLDIALREENLTKYFEVGSTPKPPLSPEHQKAIAEDKARKKAKADKEMEEFLAGTIPDKRI